MIAIPTGELTGILADVIPFACPAEELPNINVVRVEWDGERLHSYATDMERVAWCQWHPDDVTPREESQDELFADWGGADEPWHLNLRLDDAKELVSVFKLPVKRSRTPLHIEIDRGMLKVTRSRDTGLPAIVMTAVGSGVDFPDVRMVLAKGELTKTVRHIGYTAALLADFARVRARGPMKLRFTGEKSITLVEIGSGFLGAIMPVRTGPDDGKKGTG